MAIFDVFFRLLSIGSFSYALFKCELFSNAIAGIGKKLITSIKFVALMFLMSSFLSSRGSTQIFFLPQLPFGL